MQRSVGIILLIGLSQLLYAGGDEFARAADQLPDGKAFWTGDLDQARDSLHGLFERMHESSITEEKMKLNGRILQLFTEVLQDPASFRYDFDTLQRMGILTAPDQHFRILTWNLPVEGRKHEYHGFIQVAPDRNQPVRVYRLVDRGGGLKGLESSVFSHQSWPGALYYEVIRKRSRGEVFYTLLGFHFHDRHSDKKVIEVLSFGPDGAPVFGKPVFLTPEGLQHRVVFEYAGDVVMRVRYDPDLKMIVYDHLAPIEPELADYPRFYAPDLTFDGFSFRRGQWEHQADLDVRNR